MSISDEEVKQAAIEYLSSKGDQPFRVTHGGWELWESHTTAMRAALSAAAKVRAIREGDGEVCATEGCGNSATERFESGGVGSIHCPSCIANIAAIAATPTDNLEAGAGDLVKPKGAGDGSLERQYREAAAQLAAVTAELREARMQALASEGQAHEALARATAAEARIEQAYKAGFDFAMLTKSEDNDLAAENARLREALKWFVDRSQPIQAKFALHGPKDTADAMVDAFRAARAALSQEAPK